MKDETSIAESGEHSLLLAARIIALQRAQRNIRHHLLTERGDEVARAKLEGIATEIAHLMAVRRGEPAALVLEAARGSAADRPALQAIEESNTGIAMTVPPDELSEAEARDIVGRNLAVLGAIANGADRFAALRVMGSSAEEQPAYRAELYRQSPDVAKEAAEAFIAANFAWEEQEEQRLAQAPAAGHVARETAMQEAAEAIRAYAGAEQSAEYSYIDTWNPEGLPASHFHDSARLARTNMLVALAGLSDADAAQVLADNPRGDHDGSTFPAADIEEVRAYRAKLTGPIDLREELQQAGYRVVSLAGDWREELADGWARTLAGEFRAARDEQEFHSLFTAMQSDPGVDQGVVARVAHLLTGEQGDWRTREEALGAIEGNFYERQQGHEQAQNAGKGVGR